MLLTWCANTAICCFKGWAKAFKKRKKRLNYLVLFKKYCTDWSCASNETTAHSVGLKGLWEINAEWLAITLSLYVLFLTPVYVHITAPAYELWCEMLGLGKTLEHIPIFLFVFKWVAHTWCYTAICWSIGSIALKYSCGEIRKMFKLIVPSL